MTVRQYKLFWREKGGRDSNIFSPILILTYLFKKKLKFLNQMNYKLEEAISILQTLSSVFFKSKSKSLW